MMICSSCMKEIDFLASRCPYCTSNVKVNNGDKTFVTVVAIGFVLWAVFWIAGKIYDLFSWLIHLII